MIQLKIGIDIDGTITHPSSCFNYMNKYLGTSINFEMASEYELHTYTDMDQIEFWEFMVKSGHELGIYRESIPQEFVQKHLWQLREHYDLHYVTARSEIVRPVTEEWIARHELPLDSLIMTGSHDKVQVVRDLSLDLFMEDRLENALQIAEDTSIPVILFDAPYNRQVLPENIIRVSSWDEAVQTIHKFAPIR